LPDASELRVEVVKACRVLYAAGAVGDGLGGHLSVRLDDERILIKPRPVSWWGLEPDDLIVIGLDGARLDRPGQTSGVREWPIHARIYTARPAVRCVLHAHPGASTLMAALGICVEPLDQDCASLTDRVVVLDNGAVSIASPALGDEAASALGKADVLLLKNHGSIIACSGIAEVCVTAHKLEKVANTMLRASELATLPVIPGPRRAAILEARKGVESPVMMQERWRMLQDYYLGRGNG
jgi:ribulose-5-phosphate 4-epimerase/fuculose-1-phosphate aldolase